ncbi:hypothetical protein CU098_013643 [Rhizopus stolonifer]|uniref:Uncharacterized protein n=1 Tax=Rhizopus stolonifer TaxID=4846 RepID=A0A367KXP0_RHIST|nr:hypothetical protein CU098_013643 [Rhizopus stolonifer]
MTRLNAFIPLQRTFISSKSGNEIRKEEKKEQEKKFYIPADTKKELRENIYTIPNILTFGRLLAAPYIGYLILEHDYNQALGLFALAGFTDMLDGYIARKYNMKTLLGTIIDPAADKMLMTVMTITLAAEGVIPAVPLATVILGRDVGLVLSAFYYRYISLPEPKTIARYFDGSIPSAEVKPTQISKINTVLQLVLMGLSLTTVTMGVPNTEAMTVLQWIVGGTTVWSGASYIFSKDAHCVYYFLPTTATINTHCKIHIQFSEIMNDSVRDLLDQGALQVTNIADMLRYYKLGSSNRNLDGHSIFTVHVQQENKSSQLSITDISGSSPEHIIKLASNNTTLLTSISHVEDMDAIKNTLDIVSNLYQKRAGPHHETEDYLRQTILKMTNEISSLRSHSRGSLQSISTISDKAHSTFSSISNFTQLTMPTEEEKDLDDQLEDLKNQLAATKSRNVQVERELNDMVSHTGCLNRLLAKQNELIVCLEENVGNGLAEMGREISQLGLERDELRELWCVFEKVNQGDARVMEELKHVRSLLKEQEEVRAQRDKLQSQLQECRSTAEKTQRALDLQIARSRSLERRTSELQQNLLETREMVKENDVSGMIGQLEEKIVILSRQKDSVQNDFETCYGDALNEIQSMKLVIESQNETIEQLKSTSQSLYQQLRQKNPEQRRPSNSNSIISAYGQYNQVELQDETDKDELIKSLCIENANLKSTMAEVQSQRASQHRESIKQIKTLEKEVAKLTKADPRPTNRPNIPPLTNPPTEPIPPLPQSETDHEKSSKDNRQSKIDQQQEEIRRLLKKQEEGKNTDFDE